MHRWIITMMVCAALAGCANEEGVPNGSFAVAVVDDAPADVELVVSGAWLHGAGAGNGSWQRVIPAGTALNFTGSGNDLGAQADVPAGDYDRFRLVIAAVTVDDDAATLVENGFELPLNLSVLPGQELRLAFALAWPDALFATADGMAFQPVLSSVELGVDGENVLSLHAKDIETAQSKSPVARIEGFDANGLRFFQSDFIAESPAQRMIAVGPNLTLQASESEAVEPGATLERFIWEFGDGNSAQGVTVEHAFPLAGGNHTVRLTVVDSLGVEDSQTIKLAIAPGTERHSQRDGGSVTGVYPLSCASSGNGYGASSHTFTVASDATPAGEPADLIRVQASLFAVGTPHAEANLDMRLLDPDGGSVGTGTSGGTSEKVSQEYVPGSAPDGDWTVEVKPCQAAQVEYEVVFTATWQAMEPEPGYAKWLAGYDDGHDHAH